MLKRPLRLAPRPAEDHDRARAAALESVLAHLDPPKGEIEPLLAAAEGVRHCAHFAARLDLENQDVQLAHAKANSALARVEALAIAIEAARDRATEGGT
jgi:hypothetical protein